MSFTPEQYTRVIKNLTPEELNHLDRILEKYLDEYLQEDVESTNNSKEN